MHSFSAALSFSKREGLNPEKECSRSRKKERVESIRDKECSRRQRVQQKQKEESAALFLFRFFLDLMHSFSAALSFSFHDPD